MSRRERALPSWGWFKVAAELWPVIAERLSESGDPWPEEAVLADLGWWIDQVEMGRAEMPGRPSLRARWSWSEWATRKIVADVLSPSSASPADLQPPSSDSPAEEQKEADNGAESSSDSPAPLQQISSASPALRRQTTDLDQDSDNNTTAPALPGLTPEDRIRAEWWRLWEIRRQRHPRGAPRSEQMTVGDREAIRVALVGKTKITEEQAILLCRWAFYGDDRHAKHIRGEAGDDQVPNEYLTPVHVYRRMKLAEKLPKAQAWWDDRERKRQRAQEAQRRRQEAPQPDGLTLDDLKPRPIDLDAVSPAARARILATREAIRAKREQHEA